MLVVCASKSLNRPIEFDIPEDEYEKITQLPTPTKQNAVIAQLALKHIKKFGYDLGNCGKVGKCVDYNSCLACGIKQELKKDSWEHCKYKNITYKYPVNRASVLKGTQEIKNSKIRKMLELTPQEMKIARTFFTRE